MTIYLKFLWYFSHTSLLTWKLPHLRFVFTSYVTIYMSCHFCYKQITLLLLFFSTLVRLSYLFKKKKRIIWLILLPKNDIFQNKLYKNDYFKISLLLTTTNQYFQLPCTHFYAISHIYIKKKKKKPTHSQLCNFRNKCNIL